MATTDLIVPIQPRIGLLRTVADNERAVRLVDERAIHDRYVKGRLLVYLDTNFWIRLTHGKTAEARECVKVCRAVKASGRVLFPISYALWSELLNQQPSPSMRERAKLMDELSDGVSFRATDELRRVEAEAVFPMMFGEPIAEVDRTRLFTLVCDAVGDSYAFARRELPDADFASFVAFARSRPGLMSLAWTVNNMDLAAHKADHAAKKQQREQLLREGIRRAADHSRQKNGKVNFDAALLEERVALFKKSVLPSLNELMRRGRSPEQVAAMLVESKTKIGDGSEERLAQLMEGMPSTGHSCELWARRVINFSPNHDMNDFWDTEHAEVPPMYCDAFAAEDRGLRHLLNLCAGPRRLGCAILSDVNQLKSWLEQRCGVITLSSPPTP